MDCDDEETRATRILNGSAEITADEMIEKLGYKKLNSGENIEDLYGKNFNRICFWKDKTIETYEFFNSSRIITLLELKAIYKKCQEKGWI